MSIKRNFALTVLDSEKISQVSDIILRYADITMQSSSHIYFDIHPLILMKSFRTLYSSYWNPIVKPSSIKN